MVGRPKGIHNPEDHVKIGKFMINEVKFFSRLVEDQNGCHVWASAARHNQGYGMTNLFNIELNKKQMQVTHRVAMMLHLGRELDRDEFVIHEHCDNFLCCNPAHLIVGTAHDRNRVQYAKGHQPKQKPRTPKKQNRKYKWADEDMRFIRDNPPAISAQKYGITNASASYLKSYFKNGFKWL